MNFGVNEINTIRAVDFNFTSPVVNNEEMAQINLHNNRIRYIETGFVHYTHFSGILLEEDLVL